MRDELRSGKENPIKREGSIDVTRLIFSDTLYSLTYSDRRTDHPSYIAAALLIQDVHLLDFLRWYATFLILAEHSESFLVSSF